MNRRHGKTEVLPTDTPQELASGIERAASVGLMADVAAQVPELEAQFARLRTLIEEFLDQERQ